MRLLFLQIYDGNSTLAPLIGRYCGEMEPIVINGSRSQVYLQMVTDGELSRQGFELSYWSSGR